MVVALVLIMTGIAFVYLSDYKREKYLELAGREVAAAVREAQNNALTGKSGSGEYPCRYNFVGSGSSYSITYDYHNGDGSCTLSNTYSTRAIENDITFNPASSFSFVIPFGVIESGTMQEVRLEKETDNHYYICVETSGNVYEKSDSPCP